MKKQNTLYIVLTVLSLPILLHVFNPSLKLGGLGLFLGFWGYYISPIIIFGTFISLIIKSLKNE